MHAFKTGMRYALTAAVVLIFVGALHGCTEDPTSVSVRKQADTSEPVCVVINGVVYCHD